MHGQHAFTPSPTKIIAVHVNYVSRAAERGRLPDQPSYFLKPSSALVASGAPIIVPKESQLLGFEGEIAVVIGRRAHRVPMEEALQYVAGYAAANDFGIYDLRYADRGSNLRSKGADGLLPIGPTMLTPDEVDPNNIRLRTWVNGELVQDDSSANFLFPVELLIADLTRLMTLEPGDIILTGTPAGAGVVGFGDEVEVEINDSGRLRNRVVPAKHDLAPVGAMPQVTAEVRNLAYGLPASPLTDEIKLMLEQVSTATLSHQLRQRGIDHAFVQGAVPTRPDLRMVGLAKTLRYLPLREDVFKQIGGGMNAQKTAIESLRPGEVLVIDARGDDGAGTIGDILALRALRRGAAGVVTDGCLRDSPAFANLDLPTYGRGQHASVLGRRHVPMDMDLPVACGGVLVQPGDIVVGDAEGVVIIPPELVEEVAVSAVRQELEEQFILARVNSGEGIEGLYPMDASSRRRFEASRAEATVDASLDDDDHSDAHAHVNNSLSESEPS